MKRNNLSAEEAMKRVQSQPNNEFRAAAASLVIENSERDVVYAQDQVAKAVQIIRKQHL